MPVTLALPQPLLTIPLSTNSTANSQALHGAAVSPAIGGQFTIAARTTVYVNVDIPFASVPSVTTIEVHVLIDGTCISEIVVFCWSAGVGTFVSRAIPVTGLTVGNHTLAINVKTGAGVGTLLMTSVNTGLITVTEA